MHYIYKITNTINDKSYIGYTSRTPEKRFKSHCVSANKGSKLYFHSAIRKYGENVWNIEILEQSADGKYLHEQREDYYIQQYDNIYNMASGGQGGDLSGFIDYNGDGYMNRKPISEQGRKNMSAGAKKRTTKAQDFWTEDSIRKMSEANLGKMLSDSTKLKMSLSAKNRKTIECPHCGKAGTTNMTRWHFDNCKQKSDK